MDIIDKHIHIFCATTEKTIRYTLIQIESANCAMYFCIINNCSKSNTILMYYGIHLTNYGWNVSLHHK